ncbi:MAG: histone deacetylase [Bacteroidota bacterium]
MIKLAFSEKYIYKLPDGHRFPIEKYELVKEQLIYEGTITANQVYDPGLVEEELVLKIHTREYWDKLRNLTLNKKEIRRIGLPVTSLSFKRARNSVAGTVTAAENALKAGLGINLAGGTHHAYADYGEGFCVLNDLAIASRHLLDDFGITRILIVDLDVHQGNGTAKIFEDEPSVFTFSMHGEHNYPLKKERSDLDIHLKSDIQDDEYFESLSDNLNRIVERFEPQFIFFQAGVDVLYSDRLGKLGLTKEGIKARDRLVIDICKAHNIPLVITMGGGYSSKLPDLVDAHCNTFRIAISNFS